MLNGRAQFGPMSVLRSSMDRRVIGERSDAVLRTAMPGDDEFFRSRDAATHPSFAHAKKSQAKKHSQENSSLKKKGGGAPIGACRSRIEKGCGARPFSFPLMLRGPRSPGPHGAGALAFRRPTAALAEVLASARLGPRFLEPPDANGRTLSGTSAASTSQSDTRRTGRCPSRPRAQCIAALTRTAPAPPQGVPSRKASFASGILVR